MKADSCGCSTAMCGCCEGTQKLTPVSVANRPSLNALSYRVGTHGQFFETMKARLSTMDVQGVGADGQTPETFRPLDGLTTRDPSDPAIALLDSWATVADVLTFYQERIANEGYLRTATERRSVLELARLVDYSLKPGVAASVYLAYTLDDKQVEPVEISEGARSQSIPGPGEQPQSFETSEKLVARSDWNNLQVRLQRPQNITFESAFRLQRIYVEGIGSNLKTGDPVLFIFQGTDITGEKAARGIVRKIATVVADSAQNRTELRFDPVPLTVIRALPALSKFVAHAQKQLAADPSGEGTAIVNRAGEILESIYLGIPSDPLGWADDLRTVTDDHPAPAFAALLSALSKEVDTVLNVPGSENGSVATTDPSQFVTSLLKDPNVQVRNSHELSRNLKDTFATVGPSSKGARDVLPQLLLSFQPRLKETYYTAWKNATVNTTAPALTGVFALRVAAPLFGSTVSKMAKYKDHELLKPNEWDEWTPENDEEEDSLFLDQAYESILSSSYAVIQRQTPNGPVRLLRQITSVQTTPRTAYNLSGTTTQLGFERPWRNPRSRMDLIRGTRVYAQSEALTLVEETIENDISGQEVELDTLYDELTSGRWVIFSGERADIPGVSGVKVAELLMISGLRHGYDKNLPGDSTHTTLILATPTAYKYKRKTLTIYGNVVKATHGETRNEVLGSGDGAQSLQTFTLRQPPLTFVPVATAAGAESSLGVFVNNVEWHETDSLAGLGPKDRKFVTQTNDADATTIIFGNGEEGARLPTGVENIKAIYRNGMGKGGNVKAEQISLLQTRPLGVQSVINPLPASGGADKESRDLARENTPLSVMALDRLVGVQDYADFTRTFAGIGKARARRLSDGHREIVHITFAGADDILIDSTSDLYKNLVAAVRRLGDPGVPVRIEARELIALVLSAKVRLHPDYQWEPVATEIRTRLLDEFGFQKRALGQPALLCEILATIQDVTGVIYVDVDVFGGIPEKKTDTNGTRRLLELEEMSDAVQALLSASASQIEKMQRVDAGIAQVEDGAVLPAQLAIFTPSVSDTLILNQLL